MRKHGTMRRRNANGHTRHPGRQDTGVLPQVEGPRTLSLFGSVLREDFAPGSDVDILVSFEPGSFWGFEIFDMQDELEAIFQRRVDLVTKEGLRNPFRRSEILSTRQVVYAA